MKILEVNKFFYKKGGSETYLFALRDLLRNNGHEVIDFSMNHPKNEPSRYQKYFSNYIDFNNEHGHDAGIINRVHKAFHLLYSLEVAEKLDRLISEVGRPDVAHLHNFSYQLSPSIIKVLRRHKIPIVWTLHDYKAISPNYNLYTDGKIDLSTKGGRYFAVVKNKAIKNSWTKSFLAALETWLHKRVTKLYDKVDLYVAPSQFLADLIVEWGIEAKRVRQLYNFVDVKRIRELGGLVNSEPIHQPTNPPFLFVGRFVEEKGIMMLLEAFKELPDQKLQIIGAGPLESKVQDYLEHFGGTNIELVGSVYGEKMYEYLAKSKALIIPSLWLENNPIIALDALAVGKPMIVSDLGGLPELVENGVTGFIYKHDSVEELRKAIRGLGMLGVREIEEMGERAHQKALAIASPDKHYDRIMEIFNEVIKK